MHGHTYTHIHTIHTPCTSTHTYIYSHVHLHTYTHTFIHCMRRAFFLLGQSVYACEGALQSPCPGHRHGALSTPVAKVLEVPPLRMQYGNKFSQFELSAQTCSQSSPSPELLWVLSFGKATSSLWPRRRGEVVGGDLQPDHPLCRFSTSSHVFKPICHLTFRSI